MHVLFDTSILIASFVTSHNRHLSALPWLQKAKAKKIGYSVSSHSVAECFAVLTRLPLSPRISPDVAAFLIKENIEQCANIISLTPKEYISVIKHMTELNLSGGIIYDAITLKVAQKIKADKLLTLNPKDFIRLSPEEPNLIHSL